MLGFSGEKFLKVCFSLRAAAVAARHIRPSDRQIIVEIRRFLQNGNGFASPANTLSAFV